VLHFLRRMFATEQTPGSGGLDLSAGAILGFLALPGGFISVLLMQKYSPLLHWFKGKPYFDVYAVSLPDKYFFIVLSMVVTGMITVVKWNRIFPDRTDYMTFAPLPIAMPKIFAANLVAMLILAFVFALDVNAASSILFPVVVTKESTHFSTLLSFMAVHAVVVVLASLFTFFSLFCLLGVLMVTVPQSVFRRISLAVRVAVMVLLLAILCTCFAVPPLLADLGAHPTLRWLPPVWFVGQYQVWQNRASADLAYLGAFGLRMVPVVVAGAMFAYAVAYRRYFLRIPELNPLSGTTSVKRSFRVPLFDRLVLRSPFERSCYYFALRTAARSEEHCLLIGAFVAFGLVLAAQSASTAFDGPLFFRGVPKVDVLVIPYIVYYCVMAGVRAIFNVPVDYRANWVFRVMAEDNSDAAAAVARKVLLTPAVLLVLVSTGVMAWSRGWLQGSIHLLFSLFWCAVLAEVLVLSYRKIFFTCSMPPMSNRGPLMFVVVVLGLLVFTGIGSDWEYMLLTKPSRLVWLAIAAPVIFRVLSHFRREVLDVERTVSFEDRPTQQIRVLGLANEVWTG
jgi:hypothetical protein